MYKFIYPISLKGDGEGRYIVTLPDLPEAVAKSRAKEEIKADALTVFEGTLALYVDLHKPFPMPSPVKDGQESLTVLPSLAGKILLHNEMLKAHLRPVDLARRMGVRPQEITRILDIRHKTKIDTLFLAMKALGKDLQLSVE